MNRERFRQLAFGAFVMVVLLVPFAHGRYAESPSINAFRAFYCAGRAVHDGRDPYRVEPLRSCEAAVFAQHPAVGVVEPAPLAPFVLGVFAVLAMLPYGAALGVFVALLLAGTGAAIWSLRRLTGYSTIFLAACLLWTALYRNIGFAEIPPLVIGLFCVSALLLERGSVRAAAVVAVATLIEPHVAVPSLVALAIAYPGTRLVLAVCAAGLAVVSVVTVGFATSVEYATKVLPLHAAAEVGANDQYSLTWLLHQMHVGDSAALALGSASYAVMAVAGIVVGRVLAARYDKPSLLVLVPAVFAMVGGSFIHDIQLPVALPAALVLLRVVPDRYKPWLLVAIGGLAVSWFYEGRVPFALQVAVLGIVAATAPSAAVPAVPRYRVVLVACAAYALLILAIHALPSGLAVALPANPDVTGPPDAIASDVWGRFVRLTPYGHASVQDAVAKIPSAAALLLLAVLSIVAVRSVRSAES